MLVTFKPKEGNKDRWIIFLGEEKWREVHRSIFGRHPVFPPLSSECLLQSTFDALEYRRVKGYVLWRLSKQSYHSEQLAKLLRDRLVQSKTIEQVIEEFKEKGFLDDESWLQSFKQSQLKRYSRRLILTKLRAKGLSAETLQGLEEDWNNQINQEDELQSIRRQLQTRYRSKNLSQYQERQKVIAALIRKGYSFDQVQAVLKDYIS